MVEMNKGDANAALRAGWHNSNLHALPPCPSSHRVEVNEGAEAALATLFALVAVATTLNVNAASGIFNLTQLAIDPAAVTAEALPGTGALFLILGKRVGSRVGCRHDSSQDRPAAAARP